MKLQDLQRVDPDFDPNSFKVIPFKNDRLFELGKFLSEDAHQEAETAGRELIRASLSQKAGGRKIYGQEEVITTHPKGQKYKQMFSELSNGEALIK